MDNFVNPMTDNISTFVIDTKTDNHTSAYVDPLMELSQKTGLVDVINEVNAQSQDERAQIQDNFENPQYNINDNNQQNYEIESEIHNDDQRSSNDHQRRKRKAKQHSNAYAIRQSAEKERQEKVFAAKEAMMREALEQKEIENNLIAEKYRLELEKRSIEDNIQKATDVFINAKHNNDYDNEIKALNLSQEFISEKKEIERDIQNIALKEQMYANPMPDPRDEYQEILSQKLQQYSDSRDLNSEHYSTFLERQPVCNPHHPDYDENLAQKIWEIRSEINNDLKINGESSYIGTPDYYEEVEATMRERFSKRKRKSTPQQNYYPENTQYALQETEMSYNPNANGNAIFRTEAPDHYGPEYAPNYNPNYIKTTDYRNNDGRLVNEHGQYQAPPPPQYAPPQYNRGPQNPPHPQYPPQPYPSNGATYVSRQGYQQTHSIDPVVDEAARKLYATMHGMVDPKTGKELKTAEERYNFFRDYYRK